MSTAVVVGANRGIGLALVEALRARGDSVYAVCRGDGGAARATGATVIEGIDVTVAASLQAMAAALAGQRIDLLIVNAGVLSRESFEALDAKALDGIRRQFEVNTLAPLRIVHELRSLFGRGSRIGLLTSRMGSISDNSSGGYYGYRSSKAALNAVGRSLAIDLAPAGIAVRLLHPGFVRTDMTGGKGDIDPAEAASGLLARMDALDLDHTGQFWHANGQHLPW
jgi:NAD(P)-dependent dehydrogenase (short-subunit alcohol dehydrogenase family)